MGPWPSWCGGPDGLFLRVYHQLAVGDRRGDSSELHQPKEQHAPRSRATPIEPEAELIEVRLDVIGFDCALVGTEQPGLDERGDAMHPGKRQIADCSDAATLNALWV